MLYDVNNKSYIELRKGLNFQYIKNIYLNLNKVLVVVLFSENEIIYGSENNHEIGYFKLDNEYNICNHFNKCFFEEDSWSIRLEFLKNKKII